MKILTLRTPAALEATSAAVVFEGTDDRNQAGYFEIRDQAGDRIEVAVRTATTPADGDAVTLDPISFQSWTWVRIVIANSSGVGVQQSTAERVFRLAEQDL